MIIFSKNNLKIIRILLKSTKDIVKRFYEYYFKLFNKVFYYAENEFINIFTF